MVPKISAAHKAHARNSQQFCRCQLPYSFTSFRRAPANQMVGLEAKLGDLQAKPPQNGPQF